MRLVTIFFSILFIAISCTDEAPSSSSQSFEFDFPSDCCLLYQYEIAGIENLESEDIKLYDACVFIPDGQSTNKKYFVQTNDQIELISKFEITNREGVTIFMQENIPPNDEEFGWDGFIDQVPQEDAFKVSISFTSQADTEIKISYIICAFSCERSHPFLSGYEVQGLDYFNLRWPSQHDGNGGFDSTAPNEDCS